MLTLSSVGIPSIPRQSPARRFNDTPSQSNRHHPILNFLSVCDRITEVVNAVDLLILHQLFFRTDKSVVGFLLLLLDRDVFFGRAGLGLAVRTQIHDASNHFGSSGASHIYTIYLGS
jgi:hypothetical protein